MCQQFGNLENDNNKNEKIMCISRIARRNWQIEGEIITCGSRGHLINLLIDLLGILRLTTEFVGERLFDIGNARYEFFCRANEQT